MNNINTKKLNIFLTKKHSKECLLLFLKLNCFHCKIVKKRLESLIPDFNDVKIFMIDINQEKELSNIFNIHIVPTCILLDKNGKIKRIESGAKPSSIYEGMLSDISLKKVNASLRLLGF